MNMSEPINYPVTVDYKKLWALIHCADAIIRNPDPQRVEHYERLRKVIADQCNQPQQPPTP